MKRLLLAALAAATTLTAVSCEDFLSGGGNAAAGTGTLVWRFLPAVRAAALPDTNQFILKVTDSKGTVLFEGPYGSSPERLEVAAGSYTVSAVSAVFTAPAFDSPVYGDTQIVPVEAGKTTYATLSCTMLGCGIRLRIPAAFREAYPGGRLELSSLDGRLEYGYTETRTAYFQPGMVSLLLHLDSDTRTLFSREMEPREILTVGLSAPGAGGVTGAAVSVEVDTVKVYHDYTYKENDGAAGSSPGNALSVSQARASAGVTGVWVCGYIVGGDLSSTGSKMNTAPPFAKDTHFAIASRSSVTEKEYCLSVELPKGPVRDALNLVDHPDLLGRQIFLKGDLVEAYFGLPGLKNVKEFSE